MLFPALGKPFSHLRIPGLAQDSAQVIPPQGMPFPFIPFSCRSWHFGSHQTTSSAFVHIYVFRLVSLGRHFTLYWWPQGLEPCKSWLNPIRPCSHPAKSCIKRSIFKKWGRDPCTQAPVSSPQQAYAHALPACVPSLYISASPHSSSITCYRKPSLLLPP